MACDRCLPAIPAAMLLAQNPPKILDVRIAGIDESSAAMPSGPVETFVGIAITGDDMVPRPELGFDPAIEPWEQPETKRFSVPGAECSRRRVSRQADPWVQAGPPGRHTRGSIAGAQGEQAQLSDVFQGAGIVVCKPIAGALQPRNGDLRCKARAGRASVACKRMSQGGTSRLAFVMPNRPQMGADSFLVCLHEKFHDLFSAKTRLQCK